MSSLKSVPLAGYRVLDLGIITAGAATSAVLADLGADVIKVESKVYPDPFRSWFGDERDLDDTLPSGFDFNNRNKRGISINLKTEQGRALFLDLVAKCDAVVENFRRGVLERLGLDFDTLTRVNPKIVLASISSQGDGPDEQVVSYGSTLEATSGLSGLSGYSSEEPVISGRNLNYPDQVVSLFAAGIIVTALNAARKSGTAVHLDISQRELMTFMLGDQVVANTMPNAWGPRKARSQEGVTTMKCADGRWLVIDKEDTEAKWPALSRAHGITESELVNWIGEQPSARVLTVLKAEGIKVELVRHGEETLEELLAARRPSFVHTDAGRLTKGFPFQYVNAPLSIRCGAPKLGQDTKAVLTGILGLGEGQFRAHLESGAVSEKEA